ncbi:hypothetical protein BC628DRAFT_1089012 [Trametes gibbosa]|nr:hypothetical protein BC628DRAFT_1089012 [Trametes gibbosa]
MEPRRSGSVHLRMEMPVSIQRASETSRAREIDLAHAGFWYLGAVRPPRAGACAPTTLEPTVESGQTVEGGPRRCTLRTETTSPFGSCRSARKPISVRKFPTFLMCFDIKGGDNGALRASDLFKHIAFERPACGDSILALVKASGPLGLSAFLPSGERRATVEDPDPSPEGYIPHLPLGKDWHEGQFALWDAMKETHTMNIREWSLMLLQRYIDTSSPTGETPSAFERLLSYPQARRMLRDVDKKHDLALLCINDDLEREDARVATMFYKWQKNRWPYAAAWESDVS